MFKKRVKISNSHPVSNKDRKNLSQQMAKLDFDADKVSHFLNDKNYSEGDENELMMDKVTGSKMIMYQRGGTPYLISPDAKLGPIMPTMYFLFQMGDVLPLKIYLKEGVEQYVFRGADLMWPGVRQLGPGIKNFKQNQVAVVYASQGESYVAVATGRMINNWSATEGLEDAVDFPKKGKAVQIEHYLFDECWNMGSRKMPQEVQFKLEAEAEGVEAPDLEESKISEKPIEEIKENAEMTTEEWDARVIEAFKRAIFESVLDENLPMEPSDFQKNNFQEYSLEDKQQIDLRKSSFKKIGKLLEMMSTGKNGIGLIEYSEDSNFAKGHKVITQIYRKQLLDFVPQFKLKRTKKHDNQKEEQKSHKVSNYPKIEIVEVYQLGKNLNALNLALKEKY